jgi:hypothetical protein
LPERNGGRLRAGGETAQWRSRRIRVLTDARPAGSAGTPRRGDLRHREKLASANEIVGELLAALVSDLPYGKGDDAAPMVNGLGGTPISELYLLYGYAHEQLAKRGISVRRNYVGNYCTSLDMAGTSITLSRLDPEVEELLAAPAEIAIRTFRPKRRNESFPTGRPGFPACRWVSR